MDQELKKLRSEIDEIDKRILALIEKRVKVAKEIGTVKKRKGIGVDDKEREKEILENVSKNTSLDRTFVKKIYQAVIGYCKNEERK